MIAFISGYVPTKLHPARESSLASRHNSGSISKKAIIVKVSTGDEIHQEFVA